MIMKKARTSGSYGQRELDKRFLPKLLPDNRMLQSESTSRQVRYQNNSELLDRLNRDGLLGLLSWELDQNGGRKHDHNPQRLQRPHDFP